MQVMPIHEHVLLAALQICRERGGWTFRPGEIVAALPDLNTASVRTHVMSRCCANAPAHHPHRWPYFRRLRRGVYEVRREWREGRRDTASRLGSKRHAGPPGSGESRGGSRPRRAGVVAEASRDYAAQAGEGEYTQTAAGIVVEVREAAGEYRVEIPGRPDAIRSASLDDTVMRIRDALREGGSSPSVPSGPVRIGVQLESERIDPVIAEYMKGFDRTLVLGSLRMTYEERLLALQDWANAMEDIRGAASRSSKKRKR